MRMVTYVISIVFLLAYADQVLARPVLVFSGGFGSCAVAGSTSEIKSSAEMDELADRLRDQSGEEPVQVRTCYALGSESTIYVTADELNIVDEPMTREEFYEVVRSTADFAGNSAPFYVWGQSHGGWTAMSLIANVGGLNYRLLTTVDPISVTECGPVVFTGGVLTGSSEGCQRAPKDLEKAYPLIAKRVAHWKNWYQMEFSLLHSSPIPHADENIERTFNASWWVPMGSHSLTERDPAMWTKTSELTVTDLMQSGRPKVGSWR